MRRLRLPLFLVLTACLILLGGCDLGEETTPREEVEPPTKVPLEETVVEEPTATAPTATVVETPLPMCTPPSCTDEEVYYCPDECPGGCGTTCATPTPLPGGEAPAFVVAFVRGGNIWVVDDGGAPLQLTTSGQDGEPRLSPDGEQVLFERSVPPGPAGLERFELWIVNADGSGERRLVAPTDLPGELGTPMGAEEEVMLDRLPWEVSWLPVGGRVAFNTVIQAGYGLGANEDLWLVDVETGVLTRLLADGEGGSFAFSPDATALLVSDSTTVSMLDTDGTNRRELVTFDFVNTASEYAYIPQPIWAPDGSFGLIAIQSAEPFGDDSTGSLWRLPREGEAVLLNVLPGRFLFNTMVQNNLWSPDRSRFAYVSQDGQQLFIATGDGSGGEVYAVGDVEFRRWAPDNERFIYSAGQPPTFYIGEVGATPVSLALSGDAGQVLSVRWVGPSRFVYSIGSFDSAAVLLGEVGGPHRTLATSTQGFDAVALP
jgi:Tol biopolymer transport system component